MVHSVYKLYPDKRVCAQCLQSVQNVYNYAQYLQTMHSVYMYARMGTMSTNYALL